MKQTTEPIQYCVISHTHWDREWYQPFEEFRARLVDLIDNVLNILETQPSYIFHLDAQTIVLEDYLEIRPYQRPLLEKHIQSGRLWVGPWYIQNDFYLTSGESTVRNLLTGTAIANEYGKCSKVGYTPDQFGLIGQLPQILNGFGINNCIFGRGYAFFEKDANGSMRIRPTDNEFEWKSADGSSVIAMFMRTWYNNAQRFSEDPDKAEKYLQVIEAGLAHATTKYRLLMNGVDHLEAQENLLPILEELNKRLDGKAEIRQWTLDDYVEKVSEVVQNQPHDEYLGELRNGSDPMILQGTLSARSYLKKQNVQAQALLENHIEPLYSLLAMMGRSSLYPADYLAYLWKRLLKNHPHDSICACSRDAVHNHMEDSNAKIQECGREIVRRGMKAITDRLDRTGLTNDQFFVLVANTIDATRTEVVTATATLPLDDGIKTFTLRDPSGKEVPVEILHTEKRNKAVFSPINLPGLIPCQEITLRFAAENLDGMGYCTYTIEASESGVSTTSTTVGASKSTSDSYTFENDHLQVRIHAGGQIDLYHKATDQWTEDVIALEDVADAGTAYLFQAMPNDTPVFINRTTKPEVTLIEETPLVTTVSLKYEAQLPAGYDFDKQARTSDTVVNPITLTCSLYKDSPRLDITAEVDNRSKNHRLRLHVNTDIDTDHATANAPFEFVSRNRRDYVDGPREDWSDPNSGLIHVTDGSRGMAIFNEGLYEHQHLMNERNTIGVTLVRATGVINHEDGGDVLPSHEWQVPGNQCLRTESFRLAIMPGDGQMTDLERRFRSFLVKPLVYFDAVDTHKFMGGRPCVQDSDLQEFFYRDLPEEELDLPRQHSLVCIEGEDVVLSAFKKQANGDGWVARIYNPLNEARTASIRFNAAVRDVTELRLDETPKTVLPIEEGRVEVELPAKRIMTISFQCPERAQA